MKGEPRRGTKTLARLKELAADEAAAETLRRELSDVADVLEKSLEAATLAHELLTNAYSNPTDSEGIRIQSADAVKLQWALHEIGIGDESSFTV